MRPHLIKTEAEHQAALTQILALVEQDPSPDSQEGRDLELLAHLVEEYESKKAAIELPTALDALRFRMEQQGLAPRDLIPYLGSRARVSEVLAGKRPLTIQMARALNTGLGIPATALLRESSIPGELVPLLDGFPAKEVVSRGWVSANTLSKPFDVVRVAELFFSQEPALHAGQVLCSRTLNIRGARTAKTVSLHVWSIHVARQARRLRVGQFQGFDKVKDLIRDILPLSQFEQGPRIAIEHLCKAGIPVVIEPQLRGTRLDGACFLDEGSRPVIGLTLRHDRLDNFWFTLIHELTHVYRHLASHPDVMFIDDLDARAGEDHIEAETDMLTTDTMISPKHWATSPASSSGSQVAAVELATKLKISPAIVAGRIRHEHRNFRILTSLIGYGEVQRQFPEVRWNAAKTSN